MYEELVKALRNCVDGSCRTCPRFSICNEVDGSLLARLLNDAADAIEETCVDNDRLYRDAIRKFIDEYQKNGFETKYSSGRVQEYEGQFIVAYQQFGAEETFSVGQPVYDADGNLMGYLGIGVFRKLDYSTNGNVRIPVEHWVICLPTKHCAAGKQVITYWQNKEETQE